MFCTRDSCSILLANFTIPLSPFTAFVPKLRLNFKSRMHDELTREGALERLFILYINQGLSCFDLLFRSTISSYSTSCPVSPSSELLTKEREAQAEEERRGDAFSVKIWSSSSSEPRPKTSSLSNYLSWILHNLTAKYIPDWLLLREDLDPLSPQALAPRIDGRLSPSLPKYFLS